MLQLMRAAANTIIAKLLLLLLVASFAVWGIADFIRGTPSNTVASVGSEKVSVAEFQHTLTTDLQRLSRSTGQNFTMEQAQAFGLPNRILARILAEKTLDKDTQRFNIVISEAVMAQSIMEDPQFFGEGGKFSRAQYDNILRSIGLNEAQYLRQRTSQMQRQMLASSMLAGLTLPKALNTALAAAYSEERKIVGVPVTLTATPIPPMPADDVLLPYYETTKTQWRSTEYREVQLLNLKHDALKAQLAVSEADVKAAYEARKDKLRVPETRRVLQVVFPDLKSAQEFEAGLKTKSFEKLAEARGEDEDSYDLGFLTKEDVADVNIRAKAFALKKGEAALIPNGTFGPVVVKVTDIEAEKSPSFEAAKDGIQAELLKKQLDAEFQTVEKHIDEALANGEPISDIATKFKLGLTSISAVDRLGFTPDAKEVGDLKNQAEVLKAIFETAEGVEVQPLKMPNGDMIWVSVVKVTPSKQKSYEEAKIEVYRAWAANEQFKAMQARADEILKEAKDGKILQNIAQANKLKPFELGHFARQNAPAQLTAAALDSIFRTKPKSFGTYFEDKTQSMVVFEVLDARMPDRVKDGLPKERIDSLTTQYQDDIFGLYVHARQNALGMFVDQAAVSKVVGGVNSSGQ